MIKPGYKTTEFVITALTFIGSVLSVVFHKNIDLTPYEGTVLGVVGTLLAGLYVASRLILKLHVGGTLGSLAEDGLRFVGTADPQVEAEVRSVFDKFVPEPPAGAAVKNTFETPKATQTTVEGNATMTVTPEPSSQPSPPLAGV